MQSKAELIFLEIKKRAEAINTKLAQIKVYNSAEKDSVIYDPLINEIEAFNDYIKAGAFLEMEIPPEDVNATKKQVYESLFSSELIDPVELLCCAQKLDYDQLLVCARRAKYLDAQSFLFICNIDFLKNELWDKKIKIDNVTNLGILHHYNADLTFDLDSENKAINIAGGDERSQYAVTKVFDIIPNFLKDNVKSPSLKVVLRSCSGGEIRGKETLEPHLKTIAYPIRLLTPSLDVLPTVIPKEVNPIQNKTTEKKPQNRVTDKTSTSAVPEIKPATQPNKLAQEIKPETQENRPTAEVSQRAVQADRSVVRPVKKASQRPESPPKTLVEIEKINNYRKIQLNNAKKVNKLDQTIKEKGNICISQDKVDNELITLLYLPFEGTDPILLQNFPELTTAANFKQFAGMLADVLASYEGDLHINPFDIALIIPSKDYSKSAKKNT